MCNLLRLAWFKALFITLVLAKKQNVLFIIVDDLRPALGCYDDPNAYTPNIDNLASKSFVFRNAFAQQALCAPSRNSFLTSRRPDSLHLYDFYSYWRDTVGNFTTIPQHFRENGYYTKSVGKVFHPGASSNFTDDAKYSWSDQPFHPKTEIYKDAKVCINRDGGLADNLICPVIVDNQPGGTLPDIESANVALEFLKNWKDVTDGKPFFLAVGFHKPHIPFKFPVEYLKHHPLHRVKLPAKRVKPFSLPKVAWNPWNDVRHRQDMQKLNVTYPYGAMPDDTIKKIIQSYNAATTYVDDLIGKVLEEVDDDTLIILTSDHGWSRGEHGEFSKFSNYHIATRVPLIMYIPRLSVEQIEIEELAELVDIFPTMVDLTQVSPPLGICPQSPLLKLCTQGTSLVPMMVKTKNNEDASLKTAVFTQYPRPGPSPTLHPDSDRPRLNEIQIMGYSISTPIYKYTNWVKFNHTTFKPDWKKSYGIELYDLSADPDENINIALRLEMHYVVESLQEKLVDGWFYAQINNLLF